MGSTSQEWRCPACGYTKEDMAIHGDHALCQSHKKPDVERLVAESLIPTGVTVPIGRKRPDELHQIERDQKIIADTWHEEVRNLERNVRSLAGSNARLLDLVSQFVEAGEGVLELAESLGDNINQHEFEYLRTVVEKANANQRDWKVEA